MIDFSIIIPARYASVRVKAKMLQDIAGKPLIRHTYENCVKSGAKQVIIATDDKRIASIVNKFGAITCMTATEHRSGTLRIAQALEILNIDDDELIVNVQGDEPMLNPKVMRQVAQNLCSSNMQMATLCTQIENKKQYIDPNCVKLVFDKFGKALYFSRAPIPYFREEADFDAKLCFKHIGIYAYKAGFIRKYSKMKGSSYEQAEKLEQLTALNEGIGIHVEVACANTGYGVDTIKDLNKIKKILAKNANY